MSGSRKGKQRKTGRLVDSQTFVQILFHEIARYERYRRSFAVLILQAPDAKNNADRRLVLQSAAAAARDLLRACDLLAQFEDIGVLAMLLPETTLAGARIVLERFASESEELGTDWKLKLAVYPDHTDVIDHLLARTEGLAKAGRANLGATRAPAPEPSSPSTPPATRRTARQSQPRSFSVRA